MASLTDIATGVGFGAMFLCATGTCYWKCVREGARGEMERTLKEVRADGKQRLSSLKKAKAAVAKAASADAKKQEKAQRALEKAEKKATEILLLPKPKKDARPEEDAEKAAAKEKALLEQIFDFYDVDDSKKLDTWEWKKFVEELVDNMTKVKSGFEGGKGGKKKRKRVTNGWFGPTTDGEKTEKILSKSEETPAQVLMGIIGSAADSEFLDGIDKKEFVQAMSFVKVIMVQGLTKQRRLLGDKPMYKWLPEPLCTAEAHQELLKKVAKVYEENKKVRKDAGLADAVDSGAEEEGSDSDSSEEEGSDSGSGGSGSSGSEEDGSESSESPSESDESEEEEEESESSSDDSD